MEAYGALAETLPRTSLHPRFIVIDVHLVDPSEEMAGLLAPCRSAAAAPGQLVEGLTYDGTTVEPTFTPWNRAPLPTRRA